MDPKQRFEFGKNWKEFLKNLSNEHIAEAEKSLKGFLGNESLSGKKFLDIGSGSGLHSLVAKKIGALVHSFDFDLASVECTKELKSRYFPESKTWSIEQGSILDGNYIRQLGEYDVCYAWGVLHHTGFLWQALFNAQIPLRKNGLLFIAIYNDQGIISLLWKLVKKIYSSGIIGRWLITLIFYPLFFISGLTFDILKFRNPALRFSEHKKYRGMSLLIDWRDWLGGYPYEPASSEKIISYFENLGFDLIKYEPTGHGFGNNQFLFRKTS